MSQPQQRENDSLTPSQNANNKLLELILNSISQQRTSSEEISQRNDQFLEMMEQQIVQLQQEIRDKENDIDTLLEENSKRRDSASKRYAETKNLHEEYQERIQQLELTIEELENELKYSREFNDRHLQTIENLEFENEKFREENHKQQNLIENLTEQLNKHQRNAAGLLSSPDTTQPKGIASDPADHFIANRKPRSITEHPKSLLANKAEQGTQQTDFMNSESMISDHKQLFTIQESKAEEHWFNQIENLREKLRNEQAKNRDLSFLVTNLKSTNEFLTEENNKLYDQKNELEKKITTQKEEIQTLDETCVKSKLKTDHIVAFCTLLDQADSPLLEQNNRINELPAILVSYLKGETNELSFKGQKPAVYESQTTISRRDSEQFEDGSLPFRSLRNEIGNPEDAKLIYRDIEELKDTMKQMLQSLNKLNKKPATSSNKAPSEQVEANYPKENFESSIQNKVGSISSTEEQTRSGSFYLSKAIKNSNNLLWNLRTNQPGLYPTLEPTKKSLQVKRT